jgi:hypothetical protein
MATKKAAAAKPRAKKKTSAKKKTAAKKPARLQTQDLKTATLASVKAVLGRGIPGRPGILTGIWVKNDVLEEQEISADAIAKSIAKQASAASGFKLKPQVIAGDDGMLVGYRTPDFVFPSKA